MSLKFGIKSRQNSQIQVREQPQGIPSRIRAGLESRNSQKSKKKFMEVFPKNPHAGGDHGLHIPTGNPGGKRGKDPKKTTEKNGKRAHSGEKNQGKRRD